jgi:hypothetical protein
MASYLRELERDGTLPKIRPNSAVTATYDARKVSFSDEERHRSRSPSYLIHRSESPLFQPRPPSPSSASRRSVQEVSSFTWINEFSCKYLTIKRRRACTD